MGEPRGKNARLSESALRAKIERLRAARDASPIGRAAGSGARRANKRALARAQADFNRRFGGNADAR